jgi:hypothetical protein
MACVDARAPERRRRLRTPLWITRPAEDHQAALARLAGRFAANARMRTGDAPDRLVVRRGTHVILLACLQRCTAAVSPRAWPCTADQ